MKILNGATIQGLAILNPNGLTVGTSQFTVTGGKIGIGATTASVELHIVDSNPELLRIERIGGAGLNNSLSFKTSEGIVHVGKPITALFAVGSTYDLTSSPYFIIGSNGNFGIGTGVTPIAKLQVSGGSFMLDNDSSIIFKTASGGTNVSAVRVTTANNLQLNSAASIQYYSASNHIFYTGSGTERIRLTSGGNLGIGATNPSTALEVVGTITGTTFSGGLSATGNLLNPSLTRVNSALEGGQINFNRPSDDTMYWALDAYGTSTAPSFRVLETTNNRLQIDPGGAFVFSGSAGSSGQVLTSQGSASGPIWTTISGGGGGGSGTVTSVAMTVPAILSVSGTPVTTSGTFALSLANQNANLVFAGPATGAATTPTFRSLVAADIPSLGASYISTSGGTITGNLYVNGTLEGKYIRPVLNGTNLSIGMTALGSISSSFADNNIAIGRNALKVFSIGTENIAIGSDALSSADGVSSNIALGSSALAANQFGDANNAFGGYALYSNVNGAYNTAIGNQSLLLNDGSYNVAIGGNVAINLSSGNSNVFIGAYAGASLVSNESNNTFIGGYAGVAGTNNTVAISAGSTLRFQVDSSGAYINGSTYAVISTAGGTFLNVVAGVTPTASEHLATKAYVDANAGGGGGATTANDALAIAWLGL